MKVKSVTKIGMTSVALCEVQLITSYIGSVEIYLKGRVNPIEVKGVNADDISRFVNEWEIFLKKVQNNQGAGAAP